MKTYNDLKAAGDGPEERARFIRAAIDEHISSRAYREAKDATEYDRRRNVTIRRFEKLIKDYTGAYTRDPFKANHKIASGFFPRFVTQEVTYSLGKGVALEQKDRLGRKFDAVLRKGARKAIVQGVSFGFWNLDHLEFFGLTEFVPLYAEDTGKLMAGIRFWRIDKNRPLFATLYEAEGFTQYREEKKDGNMVLLKDREPYITRTVSSSAFGVESIEGVTVPAFPIIPLWANENKQSELVGLREAIDCYDLIKSGFANDLDNASMLYWVITNAGGLEDGPSLSEFLHNLKNVGGAVVNGDEGVAVDAHTIDVPHDARVAYLERLERDLYLDAQALNVSQLSSAPKTATEIQAAYEPLNSKADDFESCISDFVAELLKIAWLDDEEPIFTRSTIINQTEMTQNVALMAPYIGDDMALEKIPWLTADEVEAVKANRAIEAVSLIE